MTVLEFFKGIFLDDVGAPSCSRVLSFLIVVDILGVWTWISIQSGTIVSLGPVEGGILGSAVGFLCLKTKFEAA